MKTPFAHMFATLLLLVCRCVSEDTPRSNPSISSPKHVEFPTEDGGLIQADLYGAGELGVLLAHGGRFNKESWTDQARQLAGAGFQVLAINFRGYGNSRGPGQTDIFTAPLYLDVLAGVGYLRDQGAKTVAAIGGSLGGAAAAQAAVTVPGQIDRLVLLGSTPDVPPEKLQLPKLYIMSRNDTSGDGPRLPGLQAHFEKAPEPKQLIILDGSAHAQFLFGTEHGERVMHDILRFLADPTVTLPAPLARVLADYEAAWQNKDATALAALFTEDGFVLSNGTPPVRGREQIAKHYAGAGGPLALRALAFATDGSIGYISGGFARRKGDPDTGKFTLILRRSSEGRWLITSDMDNGNTRR